MMKFHRVNVYTVTPCGEGKRRCSRLCAIEGACGRSTQTFDNIEAETEADAVRAARQLIRLDGTSFTVSAKVISSIQYIPWKGRRS